MIRTTVDQLILDTKALDNTPTSQSYSDTQIAKFLDEEMRGAVVPLVTRLREEYFVTVQKIAVDSSTKRVTIPSQAAGFRLRDAYLEDADGNYAGRLTRINPDLINQYRTIGNFTQIYGQSYYIENNDLIFYPLLQTSCTLNLRYFKAPNHLYPYNTCTGQITAKLGSNQLQMDIVPTGSSAVKDWFNYTGVNAVTVDVITPDAPFNFRMSATTGLPLINLSMTSVTSGNVVTLSSTDAYNSLQAGDYLSTNDTCAFVQFLPYEAYQLIKLRASMRILKAQADTQNLAVTAQLYNAAADDLSSLMAPKTENQPKKVQPGKLLGRTTPRIFR